MAAMDVSVPVQRFAGYAGRFNLLVTFVAVAERESFSEAAGALRITPSAVTRQVARLEAELETRLLNRTSRKVSLTEAGHQYYQECQSILEMMAAADDRIVAQKTDPSGALRISLPVALGRRHVAPMIWDFLPKHRRIGIDASFTDEFVDLVRGGYDLAVRVGKLQDSSLVSRVVAHNNRIVIAAPAYLGRRGTPRAPEDLRGHDCVRYSRYLGSGNLWHLQSKSATADIPVHGSLLTDDSEVVYNAVKGGIGVGVIPEYICYEGLRSGAVVRILPDWVSYPETSIYIVYQEQKYLPLKVRALIDHLVTGFRKPIWEGNGDL